MDTAIQIKRLTENDWEVFRAIRLEALQTNPSVFLKSYEIECKQPASHWMNTLQNHNVAVFALYEGDAVIGLTGAFRVREGAQDSVNFGMSFLRPAYRRRGLSTLFYEARINWAKEQAGVNHIDVSHRAGNDASCAAILKFGFTLSNIETIDYPDSTQDKTYRYKLALDTP
ncbi:MAG: GNAT family protein [Pseudomonadota bacterium]